jgi:hypothetical protein
VKCVWIVSIFRLSQFFRASASIDADTSIPTTCPAIAARGMAIRPTPHPKSSARSGANAGSKYFFIVPTTRSQCRLPVSKKSALLRQIALPELLLHDNAEIGVALAVFFPFPIGGVARHGRSLSGLMLKE